MGGFAIDFDTSFIRSKPTPFRATLTARGVSFLAKCNYLPPPNISKAFIDDKSKADSLAKVLVCVQAMWCLMQYFGRVASHLHVTLLEVNTLAHAICALAIYACWWSKPFDIRHASVLPAQSVPPSLCAYMWMCCGISTGTFEYQGSHEAFYIDLSSEDQAVTNEVQPIKDEPVELVQGQDLPGTCFHFNNKIFDPVIGRRFSFPLGWTSKKLRGSQSTLLLHREDVRRWRLAHEAISRYGLRCTDRKSGPSYIPAGARSSYFL